MTRSSSVEQNGSTACEAAADENVADDVRIARERRLRDLGFEDPSEVQRREWLTQNIAMFTENHRETQP